jgi:hypothetical protein
MIRLAIAVLLAQSLLAGCIGKSCTAKGCLDTTKLCASLGDWAKLRLCRNSECSELVASSQMYTLAELGAFGVTGNCVSVPSASRPDGDVYTLTTWDTNDVELHGWRWTAAYDRTWANGEECDDEQCTSVNLDEATATSL